MVGSAVPAVDATGIGNDGVYNGNVTHIAGALANDGSTAALFDGTGGVRAYTLSDGK